MSSISRSEPREALSRRTLLRRAGLLTVGVAVTPIEGWPAEWFRVADIIIPFTDVPATFTGRRAGEERFPGQNLQAQDLRKLTSWITPIEDFFVVTHYGVPVVEESSYRLSFNGLVGRPFSLSLAEIRALPRVERTTVFECGGNSRGVFHGMVGNATWAGAELRPLLERTGVSDLTREIYFWGADSGVEELRGAEYRQNFARSMSLEDIAQTNPIIAYEMNGQPLPIVHGFPVRLIVPGWYGVAQVKWLTGIEASEQRLMTRFMARDYVTIMGREEDGELRWVETSVARQRIKSVIARVTRSDEGVFRIFGAAWSDGTPIRSVDVSIDGGAWLTAVIERPGPSHSWSFFTVETRGLGAGEHTLVSRATDERGRAQPADLSLKKTRWENNELFSRTIQVP